MKKIIVCLLFACMIASVFFSCKRKTNTYTTNNGVEVKTTQNQPPKIWRYEQAIFTIPADKLAENLQKIQKDYLIFLDTNLTQPNVLKQMAEYLNNPFSQLLYKDVSKKYPNLSWLEKDMQMPLERFVKNFPKYKTPKIYTFISGISYEQKTMFLDTALLISIDCYLGAKYPHYPSAAIPNYLSAYMDSAYILIDCMHQIANSLVDFNDDKATLLDYMVYQGKMMYFLDLTLQDAATDEMKIKYTSAQFKWCKENEKNLWAWIIQHKLLYESNINKLRPWVSEGPTTNMFPGSPSRLAEYIGWQIVRQYMEKHPKVNMSEFFKNTDSQAILTESGYKPAK